MAADLMLGAKDWLRGPELNHALKEDPACHIPFRVTEEYNSWTRYIMEETQKLDRQACTLVTSHC